MSRARDVVEVVAQALASRPADVRVTEFDRRGTTVVQLTMAPGDLGRVIGRGGRVANALRSVMKAAATREDKRVVVDILD